MILCQLPFLPEHERKSRTSAHDLGHLLPRQRIRAHRNSLLHQPLPPPLLVPMVNNRGHHAAHVFLDVGEGNGLRGGEDRELDLVFLGGGGGDLLELVEYEQAAAGVSGFPLSKEGGRALQMDGRGTYLEVKLPVKRTTAGWPISFRYLSTAAFSSCSLPHPIRPHPSRPQDGDIRDLVLSLREVFRARQAGPHEKRNLVSQAGVGHVLTLSRLPLGGERDGVPEDLPRISSPATKQIANMRGNEERTA